MLEGLGKVAWDELEGGAEVPDLLRALAAPTERAWKAAVASLERALVDEGAPSPAAAAACPFLIELVANDETGCRDRLLVLLAQLAAGGDHRVAFPSPLPGSRPADEGPQAELHRAVAVGVDAYLDRLSTGASDERAAAALLIAFLPQHASRTRRIVRAMLAGSQLQGAARASALLALAMLGRRLGTADDLPILRKAAAADEPVGLAGLVGAAWLSPKGVGEDEQLELLAHLEADAPPLRGLPWALR